MADGEGPERAQAPRAEPPTIPWGYGEDRVTAMALDPGRLYVYWEMTDGAIERARRQLGPGGPDAWPSLRVHDTSGRLFDGTNAHSHADHRIDRGDRQYFFDVGRPGSDAVVDVGLISREGCFARIARSGRVAFPRRDPVGRVDPEWMAVRVHTGEVERNERPGHHGADGHAAPPGPVAHGHDSSGDHGAAPSIRSESTEPAPLWHTDFSWEAGPYGPWHVVIRGLSAQGTGEIVQRWEIHRTWAAHEGRGVRVALSPRVGQAGASERMLGASEWMWRGASELHLGGASEVDYLGASERRMLGASEVRLLGAYPAPPSPR